ncbi:trypsin-like serine protease [Streptomyces sp. NPDC016566]|uniref:trypsin-like serine protease n=1 Tax=Streptomyces sp. NPDC016566 TaxID=3364967 RepID=UPI0036FEC354
MTGLDAERVVSVQTSEGRGSGYLLAPGLVLTAGHCVQSAGADVQVARFHRDRDQYRMTELQPFQVAVNGQDSATDVDFALLVSAQNNPFPLDENGQASTVLLGRLVGIDQVPVQTLGFPRGQVSLDGYANIEDARGHVLPLTGSRSSRDASSPIERLNFQITTGTSTSRLGASEWRGISGSALFSGSHLVGVIVEDRPAIDGRLEAIPVSLIFGSQGHTDANECLNRVTGIDALPSLAPVWAGGEVLQPAYSPLPPRGYCSETDLLEARYNVVPFQGRRRELDELTDWCWQDAGVRVRLLSGGGSVGKTRLAREICHRMGAHGWIAGIVDPQSTEFSQVRELEENRLLVVDDADVHAGQLEALLAHAVDARGRLRIVAVTHNIGPWWQALKRRYEALMEEDAPPLAPPGREDRMLVYDAAVSSFKEWYQQQGTREPQEQRDDIPDSADDEMAEPASRPNIDHADFASYLLILIQALVEARASLQLSESAAAATPDSPPPSRGSALLDYAIDLERDRWRKTARDAGLIDDPVLLERVVAISSLAVADGPTDGVGETEAALRLQLVPDLADEPEYRRRAFARWQHRQLSGVGYMRALQPLRLAERLSTKVIAAFPDLASQLLDIERKGPGTPRQPAAQSRQVLKVLQLLQLTAGGDAFALNETTAGNATGAVQSPEQEKAHAVLEDALIQHAAPLLRLVKCVARTNQDDSVSAIGTSLAAALNTTLQKTSAHEVAARILPELDETCPDVLLEGAVVIAKYAVDYYQRGGAPRSEENKTGLAYALQRWSRYLADSGKRSQAREVAWDAVDTCRTLDQIYPSPEHRLGLAQALRALADRQDEVGRFEDAHDHAREATQIFQQLHRDHRDLVGPFDLTQALCTRATAASHSGRSREALQAATEACEVAAQASVVHADQPENVKGIQAFAQRCRAWQLSENGRKEEALEQARGACELYQPLAEPQSGHWRREYAQALSILGCQYAAKENWKECIKAHLEAVKSYSTLELKHREAVRPLHAIALNRLAAGYLGSGRSHVAEAQLRSSEEAKPVQKKSKEFRDAINDFKQGLHYAEEARRLYETMSEEDKWASRLDEASSHRLRAEISAELGTHDSKRDAEKRYRAAKEAADEALRCYNEIDDRTWQTRFAEVHAKLVHAQVREHESREAALEKYKLVEKALTLLKAQEPNLVVEQMQVVRARIEALTPKLQGKGTV